MLAAVVLVVWQCRPPHPSARLEESPPPAAESASAREPSVEAAATNAAPAVQAQSAAGQIQSAEPQPAVRDSGALNERTLVGTKWARDGFGLEFGGNGKLLIGGRERAQWSVKGSRLRLYRDTTGEEHWLDIVGGKLIWEGKEISRVR